MRAGSLSFPGLVHSWDCEGRGGGGVGERGSVDAPLWDFLPSLPVTSKSSIENFPPRECEFYNFSLLNLAFPFY